LELYLDKPTIADSMTIEVDQLKLLDLGDLGRALAKVDPLTFGMLRCCSITARSLPGYKQETEFTFFLEIPRIIENGVDP
jgi:hypothetical protein